MKKLLSLALALLMSVSLAACGSGNKPLMYISDNAYNITPEEYIGTLNETVEDQQDSRYLSIPEFKNSDEDIDIDRMNLSLTLTTNDDGLITKISYDWDGTKENVVGTVGLLLYTTCYMLSPETYESDFDDLDLMDTSSNHYETYCNVNGTKLSYSTMENGKFNTLNIAPDDSESQ